MEIDANVYNLINILLKVILWSLIISSPAIIITIEMYLYTRFKKYEDSETKEREKIILGKAKEIVKQDEELQHQNEERHKLELEIDMLQIRKKNIENDLGLSDNQAVENDVESDLSAMSVKELKVLAKERGLKMYSKLNKQQLLKKLQE